MPPDTLQAALQAAVEDERCRQFAGQFQYQLAKTALQLKQDREACVG